MPERDPREEVQYRQMLRRDHDIPPLLARALDRVPHGWALLYIQRDVYWAGSPDANRRLAEEAGDPDTKLLRYRVTGTESVLKFLRRDLSLGRDGGGYDFAFKEGLLMIPSGGRRRSLLRSLIEAMDLELRREAPRLTRAEKLERMASVLRPFFPPEYTSTDDLRNGKLARTYDNI